MVQLGIDIGFLLGGFRAYDLGRSGLYMRATYYSGIAVNSVSFIWYILLRT
jgi:hypothetical protein